MPLEAVTATRHARGTNPGGFGLSDVTAICILAAPEGLAAVEEALAGRDVTIVLGAVDERLNEVGYIVPGLGDAGDRLYGLV